MLECQAKQAQRRPVVMTCGFRFNSVRLLRLDLSVDVAFAVGSCQLAWPASRSNQVSLGPASDDKYLCLTSPGLQCRCNPHKIHTGRVSVHEGQKQELQGMCLTSQAADSAQQQKQQTKWSPSPDPTTHSHEDIFTSVKAFEVSVMTIWSVLPLVTNTR